jgi:hypothetical protein
MRRVHVWLLLVSLAVITGTHQGPSLEQNKCLPLRASARLTLAAITSFAVCALEVEGREVTLLVSFVVALLLIG